MGLFGVDTSYTSYYQQLKVHVASWFPFVDCRDVLHVYLGLGVFFGWAFLRRYPMNRWKNLIPVFLIAILMEILDLRDDWHYHQHFQWGESASDILNTTLAPIMMVSFLRWHKA